MSNKIPIEDNTIEVALRPILSDALAYAKQGLKVFPCINKRPCTQHGYKDAVSEEKQVRELFERYKECNHIGLPCGDNGLVVLDFDTYRNEGSIEQFEDKFEIDLSSHPYRVQTPRGGYHYYYRVPQEGIEINNSTSWIGIDSIDVRAKGGYVIAYDHSKLRDSIPELPEELVEQIKALKEKTSKTRTHTDTEAFNDWSSIGLKDQLSSIDFDKEKEKIESALKFIEPERRETWVSVGMALHYSFDGSEEAYDLWDSWSQRSKEKYKGRGDTGKQWNSFKFNHPDPKTIASIYEMAKANGWEGYRDQEQEIECTSLSEGGELTDKTLNELKEKFKGYTHSPSEEHWKGIKEIAKAIEHMANGKLEPHYYLSSLPPGVGKSETVSTGIRLLSTMDKYKDVGAIVFLSRLEEIDNFVSKMGLNEQDYSVVSGDESYNSKGRQEDKQAARVMFSTQQKLEFFCNGKSSFNVIKDYHYSGKPRDVRVWDETIIPFKELVIEEDDINSILKELKKLNPEARNDLDGFVSELKDKETGDIVTVPDFIRIHNITEGSFIDMFNSNFGEGKRIAETLCALSGRTVRVRKDGNNNSVLNYENIFPEDLSPMLILDASGNQRKTYELWFKDRGTLRFLYSPEKAYEGLTIHHWDTGAGRDEHKKNPDKLIQGVIKAINEIPDKKDILIIHFKESPNYVPCMESIIREQIGPLDHFDNEVNGSRFKFLTWGRHTATNEYKDIRHIIMVGVLQYGKPVNEAKGYGSKDLDIEKGEIPKEEIEQIRIGEIRHNIYQAACRGTVRKLEDNSCPSGCHLYLICSSRGSIPQTEKVLTEKVFPGAVYQKWEPSVASFKPNSTIEKGCNLLIERRTVDNQTMMECLGIKNLSNLNIQFKDHPDTDRYLKIKGYDYTREKKQMYITP